MPSASASSSVASNHAKGRGTDVALDQIRVSEGQGACCWNGILSLKEDIEQDVCIEQCADQIPAPETGFKIGRQRVGRQEVLPIQQTNASRFPLDLQGGRQTFSLLSATNLSEPTVCRQSRHRRTRYCCSVSVGPNFALLRYANRNATFFCLASAATSNLELLSPASAPTDRSKRVVQACGHLLPGGSAASIGVHCAVWPNVLRACLCGGSVCCLTGTRRRNLPATSDLQTVLPNELIRIHRDVS